MLPTLSTSLLTLHLLTTPLHAISLFSWIHPRQTQINATLETVGSTPGLDPEPYKPRNITAGAYGWSTPTTLALDSIDDIYISIDPYEAPTGCKELITSDPRFVPGATWTMWTGLRDLEDTILASMDSPSLSTSPTSTASSAASESAFTPTSTSSASTPEYFFTPYTGSPNSNDEAINVQRSLCVSSCAMYFTMRAIYGPGSAPEVQFLRAMVSAVIRGMQSLVQDGSGGGGQRQATGSFVFSVWSKRLGVSFGGGAVAFVSPVDSTFLLGDEEVRMSEGGRGLGGKGEGEGGRG